MTMIIMTENLASKINMSNLIMKNTFYKVKINKQLFNEQYNEEQHPIDWTLDNLSYFFKFISELQIFFAENLVTNVLLRNKSHIYGPHKVQGEALCDIS